MTTDRYASIAQPIAASSRHVQGSLRCVYRRSVLAAFWVIVTSMPAIAYAAGPDINSYAVPSSLHHLDAIAKATYADQNELAKINSDFGEAYRLDGLEYQFTAPDRFVYKSKVGFVSGSVTTTNKQETISFGPVHVSKDISGDITKRVTLFVLGLLPANYLDTMRVQYIDSEAAQGVQTEVFMLRYLTDRVDDNRRFEIWVDPQKHYVVEKRVWDGGNHQHETIVFKDPQEPMPGLWVPTRAEAYAPDGKLAGVVEYTRITAD